MRLLLKIQRAELHCLDRARDGVAVRADDDREGGREAAYPGQYVQAVDPGQVEIEQHHAWFEPLSERAQPLEKRLSRGEALDMRFGVTADQHAEQILYFVALADDVHEAGQRRRLRRRLCGAGGAA